MTIKFTGRVASRLHALACNEITRSHVDALNEINKKKLIRASGRPSSSLTYAERWPKWQRFGVANWQRPKPELALAWLQCLLINRPM